MDFEKLNEALGENTISYSKIAMYQVNNIMKFVEITLQIDKSSLDYYYEIDVDELLNSNMPIDELETLKKQGWAFNEDKKKLILFLRNS